MVIGTRILSTFTRCAPFKPLKSIITTLEQHRRQLRHLHFDHPLSHSIHRSAGLVGMHNGRSKFEQLDHLIDRARLRRPWVVHWEFDPI